MQEAASRDPDGGAESALSLADLAPVYARLGARLHAVAAASLRGSGLSAQDAVSAVFTRLSVHAQARTLRQPESGWEPYLTTAVRNASIDLLRRQRSDESLDDQQAEHGAAIRRLAPPDPTGETATANTDLQRRRQQLHAAMAALPERERLILLGKHWHDQSNSDIGKALGVSGQRIGQLYARALKHLREELEPAHDH